MARPARQHDHAVLYAELPPALIARLKARAAANKRSTTAELWAILEDVLRDDGEPKKKGRGR